MTQQMTQYRQHGQLEWPIEGYFNHSLNGSSVMGVVVVFMHVCVYAAATVLFTRSVQRIVKDSSCDAAGLCSATTSPKAQLPRRGRREPDRKPQQRKTS